MSRPAQIHKNKQTHRFHYIPEWAAKRTMDQADIARELNVDKSSVSRWFGGTIPVADHLVALTGLLVGEGEEPAALFRHPDDDWITRLFHQVSKERRDQLLRIIRAGFAEDAA